MDFISHVHGARDVRYKDFYGVLRQKNFVHLVGNKMLGTKQKSKIIESVKIKAKSEQSHCFFMLNVQWRGQELHGKRFDSLSSSVPSEAAGWRKKWKEIRRRSRLYLFSAAGRLALFQFESLKNNLRLKEQPLNLFTLQMLHLIFFLTFTCLTRISHKGEHNTTKASVFQCCYHFRRLASWTQLCPCQLTANIHFDPWPSMWSFFIFNMTINCYMMLC